jgi:hypothetical protein
MQIDSIALKLRPRSVWEGCDLGVRLLQSCLGPVFRCHLAVALPSLLLFLAMGALVAWLPALLMWLAKPWLDRTVLFVLSRALFGETTRLGDLWIHRRPVWLLGLTRTLTLQRLSASRAFFQPVLQLEGLTGRELRARLQQIGAGRRGVARGSNLAFVAAELAIVSSLLLLALWLAPISLGFAWHPFDSLSGTRLTFLISTAYGVTVVFLEPFYVACGFGMYINRRVALEAWDIEQEFRRAFA